LTYEKRIRITHQDLSSPEVDDVLARQGGEAACRTGLNTEADLWKAEKVSLIHKSWFNLMLAGLVGALIAWALIEPHFEDTNKVDQKTVAVGLLLFPLVGGLAGLLIGSIEGFLARNHSRALKGGAVGFGLGFGGGLVSTIVAGLVMTIVVLIGVMIVGREAAEDPAHHFSVFMLAMIARSLAWAVAGMTVGLGPGIALKSRKLTLNGFLGGMIGGAIGGLLFDPINYVVSGGTLESGVEVSRAIGLGVIGASAGIMIGLVETFTKDAWLLMTAGPLKGKQFIIYKNPTTIGSSAGCEIYIFKDPLVDPVHAAVHAIRGGYEIEDRSANSGTWVNGQRIKRSRLVNGDEIQVGVAKFIYAEREKRQQKAELSML
jgi:hypothetical protein